MQGEVIRYFIQIFNRSAQQDISKSNWGLVAYDSSPYISNKFRYICQIVRWILYNKIRSSHRAVQKDISEIIWSMELELSSIENRKSTLGSVKGGIYTQKKEVFGFSRYKTKHDITTLTTNHIWKRHDARMTDLNHAFLFGVRLTAFLRRNPPLLKISFQILPLTKLLFWSLCLSLVFWQTRKIVRKTVIVSVSLTIIYSKVDSTCILKT